jgi:hypothetical protein
MKKLIQLCFISFAGLSVNAKEILIVENSATSMIAFNNVILPNAPANFAIDKSDDNENSLDCSWSSVTGITKYRVHYQRVTSGTTTPFASYKEFNLTGSGTLTGNLNATDLPMPKNYYLYVTAVDASGNESNPPGFTSLIYYDAPPSAISGTPTLTTPVAGTGSTTITYTNVSDTQEVFGYYILDTNNGRQVFDTDGVGGQTNSCAINGLHPNQTYAFQVFSIDQYGNYSLPSATTAQITGAGYCAPVSFDADNYNANAYIQQVSIASQLTYPTVARTSSTGNTYNNFTDGEIANGSIPTLTLGSAKPGNIIKVTAAPIGGSETDVFIYIDFDFDGVFEPSEKVACGFLSYKNSGPAKSMTDNVPVTFVSDVINVPAAAFVGTVRMRIMYQQINTNYIGNNPTINTCDFIDPNAGGFVNVGEIQDYSVTIISPNSSSGRVGNGGSDIIVEEPIAQDSKPEKPDPTNLTIYPNPVSGDFMNITAIDNNTPYAIYNVAGQEVSTGKVNNGTINVAKLPQGNYLLQVQVNDQRIVKQFIKQ